VFPAQHVIEKPSSNVAQPLLKSCC